MNLIPEWAPNIHPLIIHFPIALIFTALILDLVNLFVPGKWWDSLKTTILYGIGTISAMAAYYTGTLAADSVFLPSQAQTVLSNHSDWAWWTIWFFGAYLLLRFLFHWLEIMDQTKIKTVAIITVLPGIFLLYETGEHGAEMVFGYSVGTGQLIKSDQDLSSSSADSAQIATGSTFKVQESGNWSWPMGPNAVSALINNFTWLKGEIQELSPTVLQNGDNYLLKLSGDSLSAFFIENNSYKNVQVDYYMDISNFEGKVSLTHHVQNAENYDFVTLGSEGSIIQGRFTNGEKTIFAKETYSPQGMLFLRVVGNGTHFRGYIDKEMIVHGHGDAPETGGVGLKLTGSGSIIIDRIILTQLN